MSRSRRTITPSPRQWAFSDNFYADSDVSVDGHHWLVGAYPSAWTETSLMAAYSEQKKDFRAGTAPGRLEFAGSDSSVHPEDQLEGGTIWHHFARHGISFLNFGEGFELAGVDEEKDLEPTGARFLTNVPMPEPLYSHTSREYPGFNMNIPDQYRATQFIHEIDERFVKTGADLPQFLFIHLPNDHMADARPEDGYPYEESFVVDNDYALGRILEYLSGTKWWKDTAVFITEDDPQGGVDHIDSHRTVLLARRSVDEEELRVAREHQFSRPAEDHIRSAEAAAAESVRRVGRRFERLFHAAPDPARLQAAGCGPPHFRSRQGAAVHQREAVAEDGRSEGSEAVGEKTGDRRQKRPQRSNRSPKRRMMDAMVRRSLAIAGLVVWACGAGCSRKAGSPEVAALESAYKAGVLTKAEYDAKVAALRLVRDGWRRWMRRYGRGF